MPACLLRLPRTVDLRSNSAGRYTTGGQTVFLEKQEYKGLTMNRFCCSALVLATLASSGCSWIAERRFVSHVTNKPAIDFELTALNGEQVRLSDYRGKPVLLVFWAFG